MNKQSLEMDEKSKESAKQEQAQVQLEPERYAEDAARERQLGVAAGFELPIVAVDGAAAERFVELLRSQVPDGRGQFPIV